MAREWKARCVDCGTKFAYSDYTSEDLRRRGEIRPLRCDACQRLIDRESWTVGMPSVALRAKEGGATAGVAADGAGSNGGAFGHFQTVAPAHERVETPSGFSRDDFREKFGIQPEEICDLLADLEDPDTPVAVVVGPTGSGKSTVLPFRLMEPPESWSRVRGKDPRFLTRNGMIVVTQPRVQATRNIPRFVSGVLHGADMGIGQDIGCRHSGYHACDWRCRLVYVTDGTLINWIANGYLDRISCVMIDEAHERSLNIDLILGLLTRSLPRYPHLKLIIASATIDEAKFVRHFEEHLPRDKRVVCHSFSGKSFVVKEHFHEGDTYPYDPDNTRSLTRDLARHAADKALWLLKRMHMPGFQTPDMPGGDLTQPDRHGDVLGFLHGARHIDRAVEFVKQGVAGIPELASRVRALPLHRNVPQAQQDEALQKNENPDLTRVVFATNLAETSLTIHGVKHVVETGIINISEWDPETQTDALEARIHSQAGCRQRWGRAGRIAPGDAWCLYTKGQFESVFPPYSTAEIERGRLDQVLLKAKVAGVDDLDRFPWLDAPPTIEAKRALRVLEKRRCVDDDGDVTALGIELDRFAGDLDQANLVVTADRFACGIEMATVVPLLSLRGGHSGLLVDDDTWDAATRRRVRQIHQELIGGCRDDLEFGLKLFAAWNDARERGGARITGSWAWREVWTREALPNPGRRVRQSLGDKLKGVFQAALEARTREDLATIRHKARLRGPAAEWFDRVVDTFGDACAFAWSKLHYVKGVVLAKDVFSAREKLIDDLGVRKKGKERRAINFEFLDRIRLVFAWCLPDHCYVADQADDAGVFCYRPLVPVSTGDHVVQVDRESICERQPIHAFVCGRRRTRHRRPHPGAEDQICVQASFLAALPREWMELLPGLSLDELVRFVSENTKNAGVDTLDTEHRARLFLDQRFPLWTTCRGRIVSREESGNYVVEPLSITTPPRTIERRLRATDDVESGRIPESAAKDRNWDAAVDTGIDVHTQTDEEPGEALLVDSDDATESGADHAASDDGTEVAPPEAELASAPAPSARCLFWSEDDLEPGTEITAEVVGYDRGTQPSVRLAPPRTIAFAAFAKKYTVGDRVEVEALAHERFPGDNPAALRVREVHTGLEAAMESDDIGFRYGLHVVQAVPIGSRFTAVVDSLDKKACAVRLTTLPLAEEYLDRLEQDKSPIDATVGWVSSGSIDVYLDGGIPAQGIVLVGAIFSRTRLVSDEQRHVGRRLKVIAGFRTQHLRRVEIPDEIRTRMAEWETFGIEADSEDGHLKVTRRISFVERNQLRAAVRTPAARDFWDRAYRLSNNVACEVYDKSLARKYRPGQWVEGLVSSIRHWGCTVTLGDGNPVEVKRDRAPADFDPEIGDRVAVKVVSVDLVAQEIDGTLFPFVAEVRITDTERIRFVIGTRGSMLNTIRSATGVSIESRQNGEYWLICAPSKRQLQSAISRVNDCVYGWCEVESRSTNPFQAPKGTRTEAAVRTRHQERSRLPRYQPSGADVEEPDESETRTGLPTLVEAVLWLLLLFLLILAMMFVG